MSSIELNSDQFDTIVKVLSSEPSSNLYSAANITAIASVFIAILLAILAWVEYKRGVKSRDAGFVFESERDYGKLYDHLRKVGDWVSLRENEDMLSKVDIAAPVSNDLDEYFNEINIPEEIWISARAIKTYFKSISKLYSTGIISNEMVYISLDQYGYRLLMGPIRKMEVHRFHAVRKNHPARINQKEFEEDFRWYDVLSRIKKV